jgi:hypothetical protein
LGNDPVRSMADVSLGSDFDQNLESADGAYPVSVSPGWEGQKRATTGPAAYPDFWDCRGEKLGALADARFSLAL